MALDATLLLLLGQELKEQLLGARVEKINQISKEELLLSLRSYKKTFKLFLSCRAGSARVNITQQVLENPKTPPMFCMLLRKYLNNARLIDITQPLGERVLYFHFDSVTEIGEVEQITLAVELMGRHSNIIVIKNEKVLDAIKRVNSEMSSVRPILPGVAYSLPPIQEKEVFLQASPDEIAKKVFAFENPSDKELMKIVQGISPIVAREIMLKGNTQEQLLQTLQEFSELVQGKKARYTIVYDKEQTPIDFTFFTPIQYDQTFELKQFDTISNLLDIFYTSKDSLLRMKQRAAGLHKSLQNTMKRIQNKMQVQQQELLTCQNREELKQKADLLNANLYNLKKGMEFIRLENFYSQTLEEVEITLKPFLTPIQNLQKYYEDYKKTYTAEKKLTEQLKNSEQELIYLESVLDALQRTTLESELEEIRQELATQGYIRLPKEKKKQKIKASKPLEYITTDGFEVLVGRNNLQNDLLTLKNAEKEDIWFHTQKIPGSHVILITNGQEPTDLAYTQAATIAAFHSKAQKSAQVAVDYTKVKNIKKPAGAKPGMVIYETYYTAYVTPSEEIVESLKKNK